MHDAAAQREPTPALSAPVDTILEDVCEASFPPASYGQTLAEREQTVQQVLERVFVDEHGVVRSGVNGRTMQPMRLEDVRDRPFGVGGIIERGAVPAHVKPVYLNYEDALMATGTHMQAMVAKHAATGEAACLDRARRGYEALRRLWQNIAEQVHPDDLGWMPKPYAGIDDVRHMNVTSVDQYAGATLGLHAFHEVASLGERNVIERMVCSFARWWRANHYTSGMLGGIGRWGRRNNPPLSIAYFLYLFAWVHQMRPAPRHLTEFNSWLGESEQLMTLGHERKPWVNTPGRVLECMERLLHLAPGHAPFWRRVAENAAELIVAWVSGARGGAEGEPSVMRHENYAAGFLATAERVLPGRGYADLARQCLEHASTRAEFYHVRRGQRVGDLPPRVAGDDYRHIFSGEDHAAWLHAYWTLDGSQATPQPSLPA